MKMNQIKVDSNERYFSPVKKTTFPIFKIIFIIILLIILLLVGFFIFKTVSKSENISFFSQKETVSSSSAPSALEPKEISPVTTESIETQSDPLHRLIISGEFADMLENGDVSVKEGASVYTFESGDKNAQSQIIRVILPTEYTIHILATNDLNTLHDYVKKQALTDYWMYEVKQNDELFYHLISEKYNTIDEAKTALETLSTQLNRQDLYVISGSDIQNQKDITKH